MRIRGTNEGNRKAGTSVRLNTFDVLEEEDEVMRQKNNHQNLEQLEAEKRERTLDLLKEEAERMKGVAWADINDDEDFDVSRGPGHLNGSTVEMEGNDEKEEEEEEPAEIFLHMEPQKQKGVKNKETRAKKCENFDDVIADLTKNKDGKAGGGREVPTDVKVVGAVDEAVVDEQERERAKAQLRAKIQASATNRKKPGKEEEQKKKTKSERKDARRQFER